jgi:hypothetical protein
MLPTTQVMLRAAKNASAWQIVTRREGRNFTVSAEGLYHAIHITKEACNVGSIQDRSVREAGKPDSLYVLGSNVAGVPRYLFREGQELFHLWFDWSGAVVLHQRIG